MGGLLKKWQFSLTLFTENVLMYKWVGGSKKAYKTPLRNIKTVPNLRFKKEKRNWNLPCLYTEFNELN